MFLVMPEIIESAINLTLFKTANCSHISESIMSSRNLNYVNNSKMSTLT